MRQTVCAAASLSPTTRSRRAVVRRALPPSLAANADAATASSMHGLLFRRQGLYGGFCSPTRPLLREHKRLNPKERLELSIRYQEKCAVALGSSALEVNLLEDPTAGLASGPAEELTPTELETRVRVLVSSYTPAIYRLLYTPFIDVIHVLVRENLVPTGSDVQLTATKTTTTIGGNHGGSTSANSASLLLPGGAEAGRPGFAAAGSAVASAEGSAIVSTSYRPVKPEEVMARWFTDGAATLKRPHDTAEAMGKRRWAHFCRAMEAHWADMEAVMPLTRVVRRHGLREDLYVPLLRQLAMELADTTKRAEAVTTLPGLILSLANGRAPRSLGLPERDAERIRLVSALFLGVAQETGDTDLAYLALQLLRANDMETPFAAQKQLTNVFAAASRLETDWQMRGASLLVACYPKWLEYFRQVQLDNVTALARLTEAPVDEAETSRGVDTAAPPSKPQRHPPPLSTAAAAASPSSSAEATMSAKDNKWQVKHKKNTVVTAKNTEEEEAEEEDTATEQYRYFTSRRRDDVSRITALEENIEAAVRGRAEELQGVRLRHRKMRKRQQQPTAAAAATSVAGISPSDKPGHVMNPLKGHATQQLSHSKEEHTATGATEEETEEGKAKTRANAEKSSVSSPAQDSSTSLSSSRPSGKKNAKAGKGIDVEKKKLKTAKARIEGETTLSF